MRFLQQTSPTQLRLGWLRVIAKLVGTGRVSFDTLRQALEQLLATSERWLDDAGFKDAPRGTVPKSQVDRLTRMGVNYGIHAERTTALTDLGHVLRTVAPWSHQNADNPFCWDPAARWIGFGIVIQASGDVLIPLLREWSTDHQTNSEVSSRLVEILSALARQGQQDERGLLRQQAGAASPEKDTYKAHATLYPYVEPLRDLGYLGRIKLTGGGPGYRLTASGARLRNALRRFDGDTAALLRSGISRVFLMGESDEPMYPASGRPLAETLATMPPELTVLRQEEVPLDPAVLLTQAKFLREATRIWIDRRRAHDLLKAVGQRGGKVEVKRGSSVHELNVAWESPAVLANQPLWEVDVDVHDPFTKILTSDPTVAFDSSPVVATSSQAVEMVAAVEAPPQADAPEAEASPTTSSPVVATSSQAVEMVAAVETPPEPDTPEAEACPTNNVQSEESANDPEVMFRPGIPMPVRLWLQYVDHLLAPPTIGALNVARWGGLVTGLGRLKTLFLELPSQRLEEKRSRSKDIVLRPDGQPANRKPHCLQPIHQMERSLQAVEEAWIIQRVSEVWFDGDKESRRDHAPLVESEFNEPRREQMPAVGRGSREVRRNPLPALERGLRRAPATARKLREKLLDKFFKMPFQTDKDKAGIWKNWDAARETTRSIVHDAIADGAWSARSLRARLHHSLRSTSAHDAALFWLDLLFTEPQDARYIQRRPLPPDICDRLDLASLKVPGGPEDVLDVQITKHCDESGRIHVEITLLVRARSDFEAESIGRRRVLALLSEQYQKCAALDVDEMIDLEIDLHERPSDEHVEPLDSSANPKPCSEAASKDYGGLTGLSFVASPNQRSPGMAVGRIGSTVPRQGSAIHLQRAERARRELLDGRRPGLHPEQRAMLAWMAMERLISGGKDGKGEVVTYLAAAASLLHLRSEFGRILRDARAGLWFTACLAPHDEEIQRLTKLWIPDLPEGARALLHLETVETVRRSGVKLPMPAVDQKSALLLLWNHRSEIPALRVAIEPWAPLSAAGLYDFLVITGGVGDERHEKIGDGAELSKYFRETYIDISSFFAHVYEVRNRVVHGGGIFNRDHDPAAVEIYQRFVALAEPVLDAVERWVHEGMPLDEVWGLAIDKAQDLAGLPHTGTSDERVTPHPAGGAQASASGSNDRRPPAGTTKHRIDRGELTLDRLVELLSL